MAKKLSVTPLHDRVIVKPAPLRRKLPVESLFRILQKRNHSVALLSLPVLVRKMNPCQ